MEFVSRFHIQQSENFWAVKDGRNEENIKRKVPEGEKRGTETYKERWAGPPLHNCSLWPFCSNHTISRANGFSELEVCARWSAHTHSRSSLLWHGYRRRACRERWGHSVHEWVRVYFRTWIITSSTHYFPVTACLQTRAPPFLHLVPLFPLLPQWPFPPPGHSEIKDYNAP